MKFLILMPVLIFFLACSSSKKSVAVKEEEEIRLPDLPVSELDIPIRIAAAPLLAKAEQLVPSEFTSDAWPEFMHPSCDFRYKYRFIRGGLQITCVNNIIGIQFGGNYQVSGSKCLCTAGIPVTPWISGNCGFSPQPLRKVNMSISTGLHFLPNYHLRTNTTIIKIQPVDKCEVSVFSSDITQLVMDSIRSSLATFSSAMDQTIAGLTFTKFIAQLKDSSYHKIRIGHYGYFLLNPSGDPHWATQFCQGQFFYFSRYFLQAPVQFGSCKPGTGTCIPPRTFTNRKPEWNTSVYEYELRL